MGGVQMLLLLVAVTFPHLQASKTTMAMTGPWLTTSKAHQILKLYCTIPVHMAIRDQWHRIDGLEISFQPDHTGHHRKYMYTSLASVTSGMYDKPKRAEGLHPMAQVEGMVSVRSLSDSRPYYLSILMPFDFQNEDAGTYYCILNFTDSNRNAERMAFQINADQKFAYETFTTSDGGLSGTVVAADKIDITWPVTTHTRSQRNGPTVEQVIVDKDGRTVSQQPRVLAQVQQRDIRDKDSDVILAKFFSPDTYAKGENFTLSLYVSHKLCYPYCRYSCKIGGHRCISDGETEVNPNLAAVVCHGCVWCWVLLAIAAVIICLLICIFYTNKCCCRKICACLESVKCQFCLKKKEQRDSDHSSDQNTPQGPSVGNGVETSFPIAPTAVSGDSGTASGSQGDTEGEMDQSLSKGRQHREGAVGGAESANSEAETLAGVHPRDDPEEPIPKAATTSKHYNKQNLRRSRHGESKPLLSRSEEEMPMELVNLPQEESQVLKNPVTSDSGSGVGTYTLGSSPLPDRQYLDNASSDRVGQQLPQKSIEQRAEGGSHDGPHDKGARPKQFRDKARHIHSPDHHTQHQTKSDEEDAFALGGLNDDKGQLDTSAYKYVRKSTQAENLSQSVPVDNTAHSTGLNGTAGAFQLPPTRARGPAVGAYLHTGNSSTPSSRGDHTRRGFRSVTDSPTADIPLDPLHNNQD